MSDFSLGCWTAETRTDMSYSVAIFVILQSHENSNAILIKLSSLFSEDINHIRHEKKILGLKNKVNLLMFNLSSYVFRTIACPGVLAWTCCD
jgi:hypothetical protein